MGSTNELEKLAQKLASEGPHKYQHTPRRVRGLLGGKYVFDTINAFHVWEHPYYPQLYVPVSSFTTGALAKSSPVSGTKDTVYFGTLSGGSISTNRLLIFNTEVLQDLVKVEFNAIDQWFEEDVPIFVHPKDPYKRIDILPSSRSIKVEIGGVVVAETSSPLLLLETMLRTRYYLPPTSIKWEYLKKSTTETKCPYKGTANYYNVVIDGKEYRDIVWYYVHPTQESALIAGYLCFYNEKVDIFVDGKRESQ